jgi:hypothetical protein
MARQRREEPTSAELPAIAAELPKIGGSETSLPPIPGSEVSLPPIPEVPLDHSGLELQPGGQHTSIDKPPRGLVKPWELPVKVRVQGRGLKDPQVQVTSDVDRTILRVDDARDAQYWIELGIPRDTLIELLERSAVQAGTKSHELMELLSKVRKVWDRR